MALRSHVISVEKARGVRKILRWIKEAAPRKKEREEAASLLKILEGIREGHKQVLLTRGQEEMLTFIMEEFPETVSEPIQLSLFSPQEEVLLTRVPRYGESTPVIRKDQKLPAPRLLVRPVLKTEFTEEDMQARRSLGVSSLPGAVPLDSSGIPIKDRIAEIKVRTVTRERQFGKQGVPVEPEPEEVEVWDPNEEEK